MGVDVSVREVPVIDLVCVCVAFDQGVLQACCIMVLSLQTAASPSVLLFLAVSNKMTLLQRLHRGTR